VRRQYVAHWRPFDLAFIVSSCARTVPVVA
jgi:hypothetical protein